MITTAFWGVLDLTSNKSVPCLKALDSGIEHASWQGTGKTFRVHSVGQFSLKSLPKMQKIATSTNRSQSSCFELKASPFIIRKLDEKLYETTSQPAMQQSW